MASRVRIDRLLVERGLFESRAQAQAAIAAGRVTADAAIVTKPSQEVSVEAMLVAQAAHPYVSRGGVKLAAALDHFRCDPCGRVCLDVGASTGGFSDVLIARRAPRLCRGCRTRPAACEPARRAAAVVDRGHRHSRARGGAAARGARLRHDRCELHLTQAGAAGDAPARARAGAIAGTDQTAIR